MKFRKILLRLFPFSFLVLVWVFLFLPFFTKGLLPIPADIITGVYFPWLDYKWGFPTGVPVKNPILSDIPSLLYPWRSFAIDQLKNFEWPLWNPYYFAGMPLLANFQSAVFSYTNVFFVVFPKAIAWSLGVMTSPLLTMLLMYLFLKHKKLKILPSLLGSIVFSLSGFEIAWMEYNVLGHTALFLPILLLTIDKIFENKNKFWYFLLPLLVALQIFSGYLPIVIYSYLICFFYILFFYIYPDLKLPKFNLKRYIPLISFFSLGILISSIQLFPGFELAKNSIRLIDPSVALAGASYLPFKNLFTAVAPDFLGNPATYNYFGKGFYDNFYFFAGTGTILLLFLSITQIKKEKNILFWTGCLLFSLIMVFDNFLGRLLQRTFFLSGGVAARALLITDFSLAMLSAYGLQKVLEGKIKNKYFLIVGGLFLGIFFLAVLKAFITANSVNRLVSERNLVIPFFFLITSFGILLAVKKYPVAALIFLLFTSAQLLYSARKYLSFSKKELIFPSTPVIDFLKEKQAESKEPFRIGLGSVIPQNFLMSYGLETVSGYDALLPRRMGEYIEMVEQGKLPDKIARVQFIDSYYNPNYPLFNQKYVLAKKTDVEGRFNPEGIFFGFFDDRRVKLVFEDKTIGVFEDTIAFPRAFWVYDYEVANQSGDFVKIFQSGIDLRSKVILEKDPNQKKFDGKSKINEIIWEKYSPNEITLRVKSDRPGLVFLSNNFFPGWYAYIDGKEAEIYRADYTFQSIAVNEGSYEIRLVYNPLSFRIGKLLSLISFGIFSLSIFTSVIFNYPVSFKKRV